MTPQKIGIGVVCALVAFGAAFGIGKASGGSEEKAAAAESAERVELDGTAPKTANLDSPGSIPALRAERRPTRRGGAPSRPPAAAPPSSPPPSSPPPSSPPPSRPPPSSPPSSPPPIIEG